MTLCNLDYIAIEKYDAQVGLKLLITVFGILRFEIREDPHRNYW